MTTTPTQADEVDALPEQPVKVDVRTLELGGKLAGLSIPRQVFVLAIWPFLEQLLSFFVGTTDLALAGRLAPNELRVAAMDALAIAGYLGWLMSLMQSAVGIGATALVSRAIGGRHKRLANAALGQALLLATFIGCVMGVAVYVLADDLGGWAGLTGQARELCGVYLRIVGCAAPFSAVLLVGGACLRGAGDTRSPFFAMLVVNIVNFAASVLLTFGPAPIGGHGVAGIAGGTAIAWVVGSIIIVAILASGVGGIRLRWVRLRPHLHTAMRIVRVGVPSMMESTGMWVINFFVLQYIALLNVEGAFGAHMIAVRVEGISYLPGFALGMAAATLTGQYLGLGDPDRAKRAAKVCWAVAATTMGAMGIMFLCIPGVLVSIVSTAPEHLSISPTLLRICGVVQPFFATYVVLGGAMRGAGDTKATMRMSWGSMLTVRLIGAYVLAVELGWGLPGVWVALCADLFVKGILFAWRFSTGKWALAKV
ncbi:MAG: MATE family efflux transporter [Phycisphaera sp.]|nr:MATE family efflux transporter [Phycisphaera sp.]